MDKPSASPQGDRERIDTALAQWLMRTGFDVRIPRSDRTDLVDAIAALVAQVRAEENEACAKVAESHIARETVMVSLPAAIRARRAPKGDDK